MNNAQRERHDAVVSATTHYLSEREPREEKQQGMDPYETRREAERVVGEDKVPTDVLADLVRRYGGREVAEVEPLWGIEAEVQVRGRDADDAYRNAQALSDAVARMDCGAVYVVLDEGDAQRIAEPERVI